VFGVLGVLEDGRCLMSELGVESSAEIVLDASERELIRVLHVDDDFSLLKVAKQCLEMQGPFQVDTASSVDEALEKMKQERYDAVVSDYQMPGKDGLEFLIELRQSGNRVPFMIFTGKGREEVAIRALNLGADQYLHKTGDPETVYCELGYAIRRTVERRKAQAALETLGERYRRLFESAVEGVVVNGSDGKILSLNQAAANILGFSNPEELVGRPAVELYAEPESRARFLQELAEKGCAKDRELTWKKKDGTLIDILASVTVQRDIKGNFLRTEGIIRDVTERKQAEKRLKESEEKYRTLFNEAMDAIFVADAETGILVDCNQAAMELVGRTKSELIGKHQRILHPEIESKNKRFSNTFQQHTREKQGQVLETQVITKNGEIKEVAVKGNIVELKGRKVLQGIFRDISEQKKAERTTLENQQNFKALFEGNPEAAVHVGPDFCILDVNPRFEMLFGYKLDEIKGRNINDVVVPRNKIDEAQMLDCRAEQDKHVSQDTVRRKKDGSLVPVFVSAAPITVEGRFLGYVAVYKDISELKNTHKKLEIMNEKLRVTGGLTRHDVRNKLSTVTGNVYLLKKRFADNSDVLDKLGDMENAVQQTIRIFDLAKVYEMLGVEELSYIDVAKTLGEAVSLFSGSIDVKVLNECHGLAVLADSLLRQLFYNLIDNSLKYGQKVCTIRVYYEKAGQDRLMLIYEDDGVGIPIGDKSKLFKQGYSTGGSTGYGLFMIKKMMEVYGWTIQETGMPDKGAQFTITIPKTNRNGKDNYHLARAQGDILNKEQ
jgi:PAS domain S-box-containing protein